MPNQIMPLTNGPDTFLSRLIADYGKKRIPSRLRGDQFASLFYSRTAISPKGTYRALFSSL